ncbi:unnamed protein product [Diamesa serratosioi]
MTTKVGLTIFMLTVAFYLCNCSDELQTKFDKKFMKIGSYEIHSKQKKIVKTWYLSEDSDSWQRSSEVCSSYGMELAHFKTKEEEGSLISLYSSFQPHPDAWIGYTDEGHEGKWTNVAGDETKITLDFHDNEPNNSGSENCLLMEQWSDFHFNDRRCSHKSQYICQNILVSLFPQNPTTLRATNFTASKLQSTTNRYITRKTSTKSPSITTTSRSYTASNPPTTTTIPVKDNFKQIGQYEHLHRKGVTVITWYVSESKATWNSSLDICDKNGKYLVNFINAKEANALLTAYENYDPHYDAWIGYSDEGHEGRWTDIVEDDLMFPIEFHDNEPNNAGGNENCLLISNQNKELKYSDGNCYKKMNFVCETYSYRPNSYKPSDEIITTKQPTTTVKITEAPTTTRKYTKSTKATKTTRKQTTTERGTPLTTRPSSYVFITQPSTTLESIKEPSTTQRDTEPLTSSESATPSTSPQSSSAPITEPSTTERVTRPLITSASITEASATERITEYPTTSAPLTEASTTERITNPPTTFVPISEATTFSAPISEASTTDRASQTPTTTAPITEPSSSERITQPSTTSEPITGASTSERITETSITERITQSPTVEPVTTSALTMEPTTTQRFMQPLSSSEPELGSSTSASSTTDRVTNPPTFEPTTAASTTEIVTESTYADPTTEAFSTERITQQPTTWEPFTQKTTTRKSFYASYITPPVEITYRPPYFMQSQNPPMISMDDPEDDPKPHNPNPHYTNYFSFYFPYYASKQH